MKRLYFRPVPSLTAVFAVMLALLVGLGLWQIQRLHWKLALIRTVHAHMTGPALSLHQALAMGFAKAEYHRVALVGHFENRKEAYVYTVTAERPVYHVLTPFIVAGEGGRAIMVDRGYIPLALKNPKTRLAGELKGTVRIVGIWRHSYSPGLFTPAPDLKAREWFIRDAQGIARADGVRLIAPVLLDADAAPNPGGWPKGGQTVVHFHNEHLGYAITWFALALGLLGVYVLYHLNQGRLEWRD